MNYLKLNIEKISKIEGLKIYVDEISNEDWHKFFTILEKEEVDTVSIEQYFPEGSILWIKSTLDQAIMELMSKKAEELGFLKK
jgi:hypothetical protein